MIEAGRVGPQSFEPPELRVVALVGCEVMAQLVPEQEFDWVVGDLRPRRAKGGVDPNVGASLAFATYPHRPVRPDVLDRCPRPLGCRQLVGGEPFRVVRFPIAPGPSSFMEHTMHHPVHEPADADPPQPITVHGPGEIGELIPYMLGFHPEQSLVLVGVASHRLLVTARIGLHDIAQRPRLLHDTLEAMVRGGTEQVIGVVHTNDPIGQDDPLPHASVAAQLVEEADEAGVELADCLLVTAARWWSYRCPDPDCCPGEGRPIPSEPTAVVAQAIYGGLTA